MSINLDDQDAKYFSLKVLFSFFVLVRVPFRSCFDFHFGLAVRFSFRSCFVSFSFVSSQISKQKNTCFAVRGLEFGAPSVPATGVSLLYAECPPSLFGP